MKRFRITTKYKTYLTQDVSLNAESADEAVEFLMSNIDADMVEDFEILEVLEESPLQVEAPAALQ